LTGKPVLVLTEVRDPPADLVIAELNHRNVPVIRLDPGRDFPDDVAFAAHLTTGGNWAGPLRTSTRSTDLSAVRSLYWRRPSPYVSRLDGQDGDFAKARARFGFGGVLHALDVLHVNHPTAGRYGRIQTGPARDGRQARLASASDPDHQRP
jgi:hypothetical protein